MKKLAFAFLALFFSFLSYAQIEGKWKTIDDETGKENPPPSEPRLPLLCLRDGRKEDSFQ